MCMLKKSLILLTSLAFTFSCIGPTRIVIRDGNYGYPHRRNYVRSSIQNNPDCGRCHSQVVYLSTPRRRDDFHERNRYTPYRYQIKREEPRSERYFSPRIQKRKKEIRDLRGEKRGTNRKKHHEKRKEVKKVRTWRK